MFATIRRDIQAYFDSDPAARSTLTVILCYPGLHALWFHRLARWLWTHEFYLLGRFISHMGRFFTGIEIHPGAQISSGLVIDHGMGTVIGETAEIGANVLLYHNVTLGGVDLIKGKRHPTVEDHVVVGAGAQILGPIRIGARSRIGANAVVVKDVPSDSVVIGVPGRARPRNNATVTARPDPDLHHNVMPDTVMELIQDLKERLAVQDRELFALRELVVTTRQIEGDVLGLALMDGDVADDEAIRDNEQQALLFEI
jgi:serine O-acetyltransferase